jgi:ATP-binding cassette subfamily F protein 3
MIVLDEISLRLAGRLLIDHASVAIPEGARVGVVGRNGSGKTTLFKALVGELELESGSIRLPSRTRIGRVAQEAPAGPDSLLERVLSADTERAALMVERESATDGTRMAEIETRLIDIDAHSAPARAATILAGLGFDESAQSRPCAEFSGGWRMRVALAALLFTEPDLLLLDEPTNYLDLEGTLWLQDYLANYPRTVILISHDRDLLDTSVDHILHLANQKLTLYKGGFTGFDRQRRERLLLDQKARKKQEAKRAHMESFVARFRAKATKAKQAQSRLKALAKMEPLSAEVSDEAASISIRHPERLLSPPIVVLDHVAVGYVPGKPVLRGLDLRIDEDDRIALLGPNGNGRPPQGGQRQRGARRQAGSGLSRSAPARRTARGREPGPARAAADEGRARIAGARARRRNGLFRRRRRHQGFRFVGRREGAPAARPRLLQRPASADPRRAHQPSGHRGALSADRGAQRLSRRGDPHLPRPASAGGLRRAAVARLRRHREAL